MQAQHTEADTSKTLQCQQCDRSFTRPENLARHVKTHDAVHPHRCQTCGKQFSRSDLRRKHERLHERPASSQRSKAKRNPKSTPSNSVGGRMPTMANEEIIAHTNHGPVQMGQTSLPAAMSIDNTECNMNSNHLFNSALERVPSNGAWQDGGQVDPYFDYASFAKPWNYAIDPATDNSDWFSTNFFAAMRETDLTFSPPFSSMESYAGLPFSGETNQRQQQYTLHTDPSLEGPSGRTSRAPSPPNEASREDQMPFAWDPRSKPIARARPIVLGPNDPIFAAMDPKLSISETTLARMRDFLHPQGPESHDADSFVIPHLPLVNTFISLFFKNFLPQAPVLHKPTIDTNTLPSPLLAIIMVIGSVYSNLRHTRRFGIIVFDRIRQNLHSMIENDNNLMRDPLIIYTSALVCYMGLWCGNKRAFELAEALRAAVVTYTRRLSPDAQDHKQHEEQETLQTQWLKWATAERRKRLRWFVYMLDSQFFTILGMSGMMTIGEVRKWECPCDEDFWTAPTGKAWKNLMGSASEPSCPVFGPIAASLLGSQSRNSAEWSNSSLLPRTNSWSTKLLLTAILAEVFHHEQMIVVGRMTGEDSDGDESIRQPHEDEKARELLHSLDIWHNAYTGSNVSGHPDSTSSYFRRVSAILYHLGRIFLHLPLSDLQDSIGRSGTDEASAAMKRLTSWAAQHPSAASFVVQEAATCISIIMANREDSGPYNMIAVFLCHIVIWGFANVASLERRSEVARAIRASPAVSSAVCEFIEAGFGLLYAMDRPELSDGHEPQLIFRHAIQILVQLGSWGASPNLALLLHLNPGVSDGSETGPRTEPAPHHPLLSTLR